MARILITTFGSYGDLHPYLAIGLELKAAGHHPVIATSACYRAKVEADGIEFQPIRPDISLDDREMLRYIFDRNHGSERVIRLVLSVIRETYQDTLQAVRGADLLVTHPLSYAAVIVAEQQRLPWISTVLAPISFLSAYDPPAPAPAPWMAGLRALGPAPMKALWGFAKWTTRPWLRPLYEFRRELGLETPVNPIFDGQHSPRLVLALFSPLLGAQQPDWPPHTVITGFPFFDRHHEQIGLPDNLRRFLSDGEPPLVVTLGSSAVGAAGDFYRESLAAVEELGVRAVFLTGRDPQGLPASLPGSVLAVDYAPHSEVFPRASINIHQGGVGTTGQAMASGRPMLVVPFAHDQPDHGMRMARLGVGRSLLRDHYNRRTAVRALRNLISVSSYGERAQEVGRMVSRESGARRAADEMAAVLSSRRS